MENALKVITWKNVGKFTLLLLFLLLVFGSLIGIVNELKQHDATNLPEIVLTFLLIGGIVILLTSLGILAAVFSAMGLTNRDTAMGLPDGSIRAVIALGLILIFAIISVFLFYNLKSPSTSDYMTLTTAQYEALSADQIYSSMQLGDDLYRVKTLTEQNKVREDIAKNLLATISTLVVAVAGFYFGAKSVTAARGAVGLPTLTLLIPTDRPTIAPGGTLRVRLHTDPGGLQISGRIEGDAEGTLKSTRFDEFEYTASANAAGEVRLVFSLAAHPGTAPVELPVTVQPA